MVLRRMADSEPGRGQGARTAPIELRSIALRSHLPGNVLDESTPIAGLAADEDIPSATTLAATAAYLEAGVGPDDLDLVECQDTDAARELLAYEELGLCQKGDCVRVLDDRRLPINHSGGLLSKGEPLGASALAQVVEIVRQLRGQAGNRQIGDPTVGLAHTVGRGANASVTILGR